MDGSLSKLTEFAKQGHLRVLVTDVTIREVRSQLRGVLAEAQSAVVKHSAILAQLGASQSVERVRDEASAVKAFGRRI